IGINVPLLLLLLSCRSPRARGPLTFFFAFLSSVFSSGVSCGRLSCGICPTLRGLNAAKNARIRMTADPNLRYKNFLNIRLDLDVLHLAKEALMSFNHNVKAIMLTL